MLIEAHSSMNDGYRSSPMTSLAVLAAARTVLGLTICGNVCPGIARPYREDRRPRLALLPKALEVPEVLELLEVLEETVRARAGRRR
ncbi:hypothetical protein ACWDNT_33645, partial [Streptomyces sp. NPDC000963]